MLIELDPGKFIKHLHSIYPDGYVSGTGGCLKFHLLLLDVYRESAHGYYNGDHVITYITGEGFFDYRGEVPMAESSGYDRMTKKDFGHLVSSFRDVIDCTTFELLRHYYGN